MKIPAAPRVDKSTKKQVREYIDIVIYLGICTDLLLRCHVGRYAYLISAELDEKIDTAVESNGICSWSH